MTAFLHHLSYDFKTGIRDRSKLLMFYLFPLIFFLLLGGLMTSINPLFRQTMLPGMILFAFMCSSLLNLPGVLVNAREAGVFRSYRINGVPALSTLAVPVIGSLVHMAVVALLMLVAGPRLYGALPPSNSAGFALAALLSFACYAGIGVLIGVAAGNSTVSILVAQLIYIPSIVLGGLMVPGAMLPPTLRRLALLLPASHAMRVLEGLGMPGSSGTPWASLAVLASSSLLSFALAALLFEWDSRASQPSPRAWAALLALLPFAASAFAGA